MIHKSITFRCSASQHARLHTAMADSGLTRSEFISAALEHFLDYAEQSEIRSKNLFELVQDVDAHGHGPSFAEQA